MFVPFVSKGFGPVVVYFVFFWVIVLWKQAFGLVGLPLLVAGLPAAFAVSLVRTIGWPRLANAIRGGWGEYWNNKETVASKMFSGGLFLTIPFVILWMPVLAYAAPADEAIKNGVLITSFALVGLTALLFWGGCWEIYVENSRGNPERDPWVIRFKRFCAAVQPAGPPLAILGATLTLMGIGFMLGLALTPAIVRDQVLREVEEERKASQKPNVSRSSPPPPPPVVP